MNPARFSTPVLALALLLGAAGPASARSSDRNEPAEIDAGHWVDDPDRGVQVFSQGFTLVQGTRRISGEKATVYRADDGGFQRIVLEGDPARWEEEMDDGGRMAARARSIDYQMSEDLVVLKEQVVVNKQRDEITGEHIRYNLATQRLDAGGDSGVSIRITPQTRQDGS